MIRWYKGSYVVADSSSVTIHRNGVTTIKSDTTCLDFTELLALGHRNGSVTVHGESIVKIEPRQQRGCTSVKLRDNLLAIGLEKVRNDSSLTVYDVNGSSVGQFAGTEGVSSLCWIDSFTILAGLNRALKVIDIRDPRDAASIPTKAVFHACSSDNMFASSYADTVMVWDRRNNSSLTLSGSRVKQLRWSRPGHLCALRDSWDLYQLGENPVHVVKHDSIPTTATDFDFTDGVWDVICLDGDVAFHSFDTTPPVVHFGSRNDVAVVNHKHLMVERSLKTAKEDGDIDYYLTRSLQEVLRDDISTTMYNNVPRHEAIWEWIAHNSTADLCFDGIDYSFEGVRFQKEIALASLGPLSDGPLDQLAFYAIADNDVDRAVEILSRGDSTLRIMAAAIAGYNASKGQEQRSRVWKESCKRLATELDSPYIRAIFAYVSHGWHDVLDEQSLTLKERLIIAIKYLKEDDLTSTLADIQRTETAEGNLEGLLLTGITYDAIQLLQTYVDRTADVQTAALIASYRPELYEDRRVRAWIEDYRHLLNSWGMFHIRCRFDVERNKRKMEAGITRNPPRQVFVRCHHCNANIGRSGKKVKSTQCPNCRKALPRCALCLLPCGNDLINFCLSCGHSLHSDHAAEWFQGHSLCPVPGCSCQCI